MRFEGNLSPSGAATPPVTGKFHCFLDPVIEALAESVCWCLSC